MKYLSRRFSHATKTIKFDFQSPPISNNKKSILVDRRFKYFPNSPDQNAILAATKPRKI
jgi:hypothetical protein